MRATIFISILAIGNSVSAFESLDELEARASRKLSHTFYSGETPSNSYIWQPQTVIYVDDTTGHEVIIWTQTDNSMVTNHSMEYGWLPWSADGKRIAWHMDLPVGSYSTQYGYPWFVARADQTFMRPFSEGPARTSYRQPYFDWSRSVPDTAHQLGYSQSGVIADQDTVYEVSVTNTGGSHRALVDLGLTSSRVYNGMKGAVSSDGLFQVFSMNESSFESSPFYFVDLLSESIVINWDISDLNLDLFWTGTSESNHIHDEYLIGNSANGYWLEFYWTSPDACHWRARMQGSDAGVPTHTSDHFDPYDWWSGTASQTEVQVLGGYFSGINRPFNIGYWSHHSWDAWGKNVAFNDGDQYCPSWHSGLTITHLEDMTQNYCCGCNTMQQYAAWGGFTDFVVGVSEDLGTMKYDSDIGGYIVFNHHSSITGEFTKPGQSPDGTKAAVHSDWLNPGSGTRDLFVGVVYFPYPPEITQVSASGGGLKVRFDWRLSTTPRGYTARGWPDEDNDNPPPPRETAKFRLWRSDDGAVWTPVTTVDAELFGRYDYADGRWNGDDYWEISDNPGDGTFFFAVTSLEWSGLESRTHSNVFSITIDGGAGSGSESSPYPNIPGDTDDPGGSDFYTVFDPSHPELIRYYNIYAEDGSVPSVDQTNRVASFPAGACIDGACTWVDWLGNPSGETNYVVTPVDTQGNEGHALPATSTHQMPPATASGQYTIEWHDISGETGVIFVDGFESGNSSAWSFAVP